MVLNELRTQAIAKGMRLLSADEVLDEVSRRRSGGKMTVMTNKRYKEMCHYSKTGWAWSNPDGDGCTCRACPPPKSSEEILPGQRLNVDNLTIREFPAGH